MFRYRNYKVINMFKRYKTLYLFNQKFKVKKKLYQSLKNKLDTIIDSIQVSIQLIEQGQITAYFLYTEKKIYH